MAIIAGNLLAFFNRWARNKSLASARFLGSTNWLKLIYRHANYKVGDKAMVKTLNVFITDINGKEMVKITTIMR